MAGKLSRYHGKEKNVIIPDGIDIINDFAFRNNSITTRVYITDSMNEIGDTLVIPSRAVETLYRSFSDGLKGIKENV